jgi:transcriptional regulator with XRE-family HTH domain
MTTTQVTGAVPVFELRHRLALALEAGRVRRGEMARVLGVHRNTIVNYLTGRTEPPRSVLVAWALRCGVPLYWLMTGEEPDPDDPATSTIWYSHRPSVPELAVAV